jgi:hypothetical protein
MGNTMGSTRATYPGRRLEPSLMRTIAPYYFETNNILYIIIAKENRRDSK